MERGCVGFNFVLCLVFFLGRTYICGFSFISLELIFPDVSKFDLMIAEVAQHENVTKDCTPADIEVSSDTDGQVSNEAIPESSYSKYTFFGFTNCNKSL